MFLAHWSASLGHLFKIGPLTFVKTRHFPQFNVAGHIFHKCNGWLRTQPPPERDCIHKSEGEMRKTGVIG